MTCSRPGGRELGSGWSAPHARERGRRSGERERERGGFGSLGW